ncbi:hypothetical protein GQ457_11G014210 [Hibiscus cannabinus]
MNLPWLGLVIVLAIILLVKCCLIIHANNRAIDQINRDRRRRQASHPVVGIMQSWTSNGDLENQLSSDQIVDHIVQREPSQNRHDKTSRSTTNGEEIELRCTADCVICLEEFKDGDSCSVLPNCKHVYHQFCIDQWLAKNRHCPLCRDSVTADLQRVDSDRNPQRVTTVLMYIEHESTGELLENPIEHV